MKHHDGFLLFDLRYNNEHDWSNTVTAKNGGPQDLFAEIVKSARKYRLKLGASTQIDAVVLGEDARNAGQQVERFKVQGLDDNGQWQDLAHGTTIGQQRKMSLPVGMGMYLPVSLTVLIVVGAFIGLAYDKWAERRKNPEAKKRLGTLLATGLIVGKSIFGVLNAGIIAGSGNEAPLAIMPTGFAGWDQLVGAIVFVVAIVLSYKWLKSLSTAAQTASPELV